MLDGKSYIYSKKNKLTFLNGYRFAIKHQKGRLKKVSDGLFA